MDPSGCSGQNKLETGHRGCRQNAEYVPSHVLSIACILTDLIAKIQASDILTRLLQVRVPRLRVVQCFAQSHHTASEAVTEQGKKLSSSPSVSWSFLGHPMVLVIESCGS